VREETAARVRAQVAAICARRGLQCSVETRHEAPAAACHPDIIAGLISACRDAEEARCLIWHASHRVILGFLVLERCCMHGCSAPCWLFRRPGTCMHDEEADEACRAAEEARCLAWLLIM
jgi:hypothetical protein